MDFHAMGAQEVLREIKTDPKTGLTRAQAQRQLEAHGENRLKEKKGSNVFVRFLLQFKDLMVITLLIAAGISFFTARAEGDSNYLDPIIILGIVVLNAVVGVIQESKAEHALEKLKQLSAPEALVLRGGKTEKIHASLVVPGDILVLSAGDCVAADARLLESIEMSTQESALTGEAMPCEKSAAVRLEPKTPTAEQKNMVFASSTVLTGHGRAVVTATGMNTNIGKIADLLGREQSPRTPLQLRLEKTGRLLGLGAVAICAVIFVMGLLRRDNLLDSFMLAVSLAVAAIPEGLPAVVTIVLSVGVGRMAKSNAIVRRLTAVEALGSATYICSDKTGTLTQNLMTVRRLCAAFGQVDAASPEGKEILKYAALCCNSTVSSGKSLSAQGEPTENAIVLAAAKQGLIKGRLDTEFCRLSEVPFSSVTKRMSVVVSTPQGRLLIAKGAPEVLLPLCAGGEGMWQIFTDSMAGDGLRVLGVAIKRLAESETTAENMEFVGLVGIEDPERPEAGEAVATCRRAGITPVMITGDNLRTACAVAKRLGILEESSHALTGGEIDLLDDAGLENAAKTVRVYARVSPEHKVRIVKALRSAGQVVAMTGDGVNDAPALKAADIGCAMGKSGTEVAKGAADIVLADDNFATVVRAVREGRGIYDNIKKVVHFLLSSNVGEILLVFVAGIMHLPTPLLPIQLLWVNLVTDSLPAMALGVEKIDDGVMLRKPVDPRQNLFSGGAWADIALEGMLIGALALVAFTLGNAFWGEAAARTMCFCTLSITELAHALNSRSSRSLFKIGIFSNLRMSLAFAVCLLLQLAVVTSDAMNTLFSTTELTLEQWLIVTGLSAFIILAVEIAKRVNKR